MSHVLEHKYSIFIVAVHHRIIRGLYIMWPTEKFILLREIVAIKFNIENTILMIRQYLVMDIQLINDRG